MRPNDNDNRRLGTPLIPQRSYVHTPPTSSPQSNSHSQRHADAAADIIRDQIDTLYSQDPHAHYEQQPIPAANSPQPTTTSQPTDTQQPTEATQQELTYKNPYQRTQMNTGQIQAQQWKQYHSAWQDYYQKYYERYYIGQVQRTQQSLEARAAQATHTAPSVATPSNAQAIAPPAATQSTDSSVSRDDALRDLRSKLRDQIHDSAVKVRKSRHFVPIAAALSVVIVFAFLQYNRVLFANVHAYISPGNVDSANVIIDPMSELSVGDEPKLIIPKINVDVPADFTAAPDHNSQMAAMENGIAWFGIPGANSKPGQVGNTVLSGHSSNDIIDQGNYKFVFARLDALQKGDNIYINYEGKRYVYSVTQKETVKPTQVDKLIYPTDKPVLTLITCTPLGTSLNRLLVTAEQISPSPSAAAAAPERDNTQAEAAMPGNSPTFMQRIFGGGNS